jgi:hypothetical protein
MMANSAKIEEVRSMKNMPLSHMNETDEMDLDNDEIIPNFGEVN